MAKVISVESSMVLNTATEEYDSVFIDSEQVVHEYLIDPKLLIKQIRSADYADLSINKILAMIDESPRFVGVSE